MIDSARSSTVQFLASGIKYLIEKNDIDKVKKIPSDSIYKQSSGIILLFIINLASVVEGILREYLIDMTYESFKVLKPEYTSKHENLSRDKSYKFIANTLSQMSYNSLKKYFKIKCGEKFDMKFENKCIGEDIEMLFNLRNLIVHSNPVKFKWGEEGKEDKYEGQDRLTYNCFSFEGKYKKIYDFLKKKKLVKDEDKEKWFIDNFSNKKILTYFYKLVFDKYLKLDIWNNCGRVLSIKNNIMK